MVRLVSTFLMVLFLSTAPVCAQDLKKPTGPVILTVTGKIQHKNSADAALFDVAMLEALDWKTIITTTRWHEGTNSFAGPDGRSFLKAIGVTDANAMMKVTALNDYSAEVPVRDFMESGLILAMKKNETFMSIREKGPLFIIYPFSDNPDLETDAFYTRSVWQIKAIEVK